MNRLKLFFNKGLIDRPIKSLIFILIIFISIRIIWQIVIFNNIQADFGWVKYNDGYHIIAKNVLEGKGFTKLNKEGVYVFKDHPPMTVFLYVIVFFIFGYGLEKIFILNCLLYFISVILLYKITMIVLKSRLVSFISALIFSIYPMFFNSTSLPSTEALYILLELFIVKYILQNIANQKYAHFFLLGILLCFFYLTRQTALIYLPVFVILSLYVSNKTINKVINPILLIAGFILVNSFWGVYKNNQISKTNSDVVSDGSIILLKTAVEGIRIKSHGSDETAMNERKKWNDLIHELQEKNSGHLSNKIIFKESISRISKKPIKYILRRIEESIYFWYLGKSPETTFVNMVFQIPTAIIGFLGLILGIKRKKKIGVFFAIIFPLWFLTSMLHAIGRYSFPIIPFLIMFGVYFLHESFKRNNEVIVPEYRKY